MAKLQNENERSLWKCRRSGAERAMHLGLPKHPLGLRKRRRDAASGWQIEPEFDRSYPQEL